MTPLEVNQALETVSSLLLKQTFISPVIWILIPYLIPTVVLSLTTKAICFFMGISVLVLNIYKKRTKLIIIWKNETVVITGGSNGVGKSLAEMLINNGAKVITLDLMDGKIDGAQFYKCDISNPEQVQQVASQILSTCTPTMLVNNAGIVRGKRFVDASVEDFQKTINVNVLGQMYMTKAFLPTFIKQNHGHILTVSSVMGLFAAAYATDYCASKFAMTGFNEALRQELLKTKVRVSCIYPGLIETGMFDGVKHTYPYATPHLPTEMVSKAMFDTLGSGISQNVHLPFYSNFCGLFRLISVELSDFLHEAGGANEDLKHYNGSISAKLLQKLEE